MSWAAPYWCQDPTPCGINGEVSEYYEKESESDDESSIMFSYKKPCIARVMRQVEACYECDDIIRVLGASTLTSYTEKGKSKVFDSN